VLLIVCVRESKLVSLALGFVKTERRAGWKEDFLAPDSGLGNS